jgi:hypothetical protein
MAKTGGSQEDEKEDTAPIGPQDDGEDERAEASRGDSD